MSKESKYSFSALFLLLISGVTLYVLVSFDKAENSFYSAGGIVSFTQYFLLSSSLLALVISVLGAYLCFCNKIVKKALFLGVFAYFPLIFVAFLLFYTSMLFLCKV